MQNEENFGVFFGFDGEDVDDDFTQRLANVGYDDWDIDNLYESEDDANDDDESDEDTAGDIDQVDDNSDQPDTGITNNN